MAEANSFWTLLSKSRNVVSNPQQLCIWKAWGAFAYSTRAPPRPAHSIVRRHHRQRGAGHEGRRRPSRAAFLLPVLPPPSTILTGRGAPRPLLPSLLPVHSGASPLRGALCRRFQRRCRRRAAAAPWTADFPPMRCRGHPPHPRVRADPAAATARERRVDARTAHAWPAAAVRGGRVTVPAAAPRGEQPQHEKRVSSWPTRLCSATVL